MLAGAFSWITDLTDALGDWAANWWFLAVVFAIALGDSIVPVVPSETTVIVAGVAVSVGDAPYSLWMVIAAGALGAFCGDNLAYSIGRRFAPRFERRAARSEKFARRLRWAAEQIGDRGGLLLVTVRFIPGGRTVLTLACGITRQRRLWFMMWAAVAATIWASYAAGLAYAVGKPFEDDHTTALLVAFGVALGVNVVIEVVRYRLAKRRARSMTTVDVPAAGHRDS